jgi:hypothetical protein
MFYKVIYLTFSGSSLPAFMDISWWRHKARCRLFTVNFQGVAKEM